MKFIDSRVISYISFIVLFAGMCFGLGVLAVKKDWVVWQKTKEIRSVVRSLQQTGAMLPDKSYFPRSPTSGSQGYTVKEPDLMAQGWIGVTRLDAQSLGYSVDLIDAQGDIAHSWPINYSRLVEDGDQMEFPHASKILADGSVLISFDDGQAMARLDQCGDVVWKRTGEFFHHVFQPAAQGFWTWNSPVNVRAQDQNLLRFDVETGDTLETISLIDQVVLSSTESTMLATIPGGFEFVRDRWNWGMSDIFHPNDIEPLPANLADAFPQFSEGDLLISLRNLNLVAVVDRETHEFLWSMFGPWREQHDPDWQADGTITVFNNNVGRGRSNIVRVDPKTDQFSQLFTNTKLDFYTQIMGEHQLLPNGNWLILSTNEGRVVEVDPTGDLVREYVNEINDDYVAIVPNAEFLPVGFFDTTPNCSR